MISKLMFQYLFFQTILNRVTRIFKCFKLFIHHHFKNSKNDELSLTDHKNHVMEDEISVGIDEMELVMKKLGIFCDEKLPQKLSCGDLFNMFEELDEQPRLDEMKGAFDVFDENRDGFIDARELQRVLCALGSKDRAATDECMKMISVFDEDGDGRIDFKEFAKLMETTFY